MQDRVKPFIALNSLKPPHKPRLLRFLRSRGLTPCFSGTVTMYNRDQAIIERKNLPEIIESIRFEKKAWLEESLQELLDAFYQKPKENTDGNKS